MPYQSLFQAKKTKSGEDVEQSGAGYKSLFGLSTDNMTKPKTAGQPKTAQVQTKKPAPQPKESFVSKVKKVTKEVAKAAVGSEQTAATGIARVLPGGTADLDAKAREAEADRQNLARAAQLKKTGKVSAEKYKKLTGANAKQTNASSKDLAETEKKMPTKGQIGAGFAGTAADIISGGQFSAVTKGAKVAKVAKVANATNKATKAAKVIKVTKAGAPVVVSSAAAGGFNAAAVGGEKKDVIQNTLIGAAAPIALGGAAELTSKAAKTIMSKVKPSGEFLKNTKTQSLLKQAQDKKTAAAQVEGTKLDQQIELIEAKKADGKFTNVDDVKVKQLKQQKQELGLEEAAQAESRAVYDEAAGSDIPVVSKTATELRANLPAEGSLPKTTALTSKVKVKPAAAKAALEQPAEAPIQGLDGYTHKDVDDVVRSHVDQLKENLELEGIDDFDIKATGVTGSRSKGVAKDGSDLDVLVEYTPHPGSDVREDDLFNALNREPLEIDGIKVDLNPIRADKSGTIPEYRKMNEKAEGKYAPKTEAAPAKEEIDSFKKDFDELRAQAADEVDEGIDDAIDPILEKKVGDAAEKLGLDMEWNDSWSGYMLKLKPGVTDMKDGAAKIEQIAKAFDMDVKVNPDGSLKMYHGTSAENADAILKGGFEDQTTFLSPSLEPEFNGVNGAEFYGDSVIEVNVDPRHVTVNPSGEFSVDDVSAIKKVSKFDETPKPKTEGVKNVDKTETPTEPAADAATRTLAPSETSHMEEIGGYTHSKDMVNEYADSLRGMELQAKGGQMVKQADGSMKRISEHSKFYREYFAEHKKAPTIAAYREQAAKELGAGTDQFGAGADYQKLLEREAKPVPRVEVEPTVKDVPQGTSKVAKRIARDIKEQYGDLAQYDKLTIADQAAKAEKLIGDRELLDKVIAGTAPLPDGLRATSIITAVRNDPKLLEDVALLKRLASSPLASESSLSAQELRLAAENAKHDPVMAIRNLQKAREAAAEKRLKKPVTKAVGEEVKAIQAATPKVQKETWESFVDSLKC